MSEVRLVLARLPEGSARERERTTHLVPAADGLPRGDVHACCGSAFPAGELELLDHVTGMPCEDCLRRAPAFSDEVPQLAAEDGARRLERVEVALARLDSRVGELAAEVRKAVALISGESGEIDCG